jgi:predicted DNA-binding transcriptional regulator AlpA
MSKAAAAKPVTARWTEQVPRTLEELKRSGPPTLSPEECVPYLGVGRSTIYAAIAADEFPLKVIRVRRRLRIVTSSLIRLLEDEAAGP